MGHSCLGKGFKARKRYVLGGFGACGPLGGPWKSSGSEGGLLESHFACLKDFEGCKWRVWELCEAFQSEDGKPLEILGRLAVEEPQDKS